MGNENSTNHPEEEYDSKYHPESNLYQNQILTEPVVESIVKTLLENHDYRSIINFRNTSKLAYKLVSLYIPDDIVYLETIDANYLRALVNFLKEFLSDVVINFNSDGMRIHQVDDSGNVLIDITLRADRFQQYFCINPITVPMKTRTLYDILKSSYGSDLLTIRVDGNKFHLNYSSDQMNSKYLVNISPSLPVSIHSENFNDDDHEVLFNDDDYSIISSIESKQMVNILNNIRVLGATQISINYHNRIWTFGNIDGNLGNTKINCNYDSGENSYYDEFDLRLLRTICNRSHSKTFTLKFKEKGEPMLIIAPHPLGEIRLAICPLINNTDDVR